MQTTDLLKAFADPVRLRILHLLRNRGPEVCVCDLVDVLDIPQSTVSRHLMHLRRLKLVVDRRVGNWMHYSVAEANAGLHKALVDCLGSCLGEEAELREDLKRFDKLHARSQLACCASDCCEDRPRVSDKSKREAK